MSSATGGYMAPTSSQPLPGGLTLTQFIQSVIVGISSYNGTLVRPKWQANPPKQPSIETDWIAFGIANILPDANAYTNLRQDGTYELQRQETMDIQVAFYGPNAAENISIFRDGFQVTQNLEALLSAGMGFKGISSAIRGPDLLNERWVERYETVLTLVRLVQRVYPVLSFASASGTIHTVIAEEDRSLNWQVEEQES